MSQRVCRTTALLITMALALAGVQGYSDTINVYSNSASWQAAAGNTQLIDFEGMTSPGQFTSYPGGISSDGVDFIGLDGSTLGVMDTSAVIWDNFGTGDAATAVSGTTPSFRILMPPGVTAFGLDLFTNPPAITDAVTIGGIPFTVPTIGKPTPTFFGVVSTDFISTVDITARTNSGTYAFFDNFRWDDQVRETPEPRTFVLLASGLIAVAAIGRRRRRSAAVLGQRRRDTP